ncbi:cytochrome P450 [Phytohabitans aurantiacus]|uniref:Biflaviolin synthase CYP158A2 n=1 Tax=Phytohabitans aurantiacus TaxID=3016789 RepID=A0ABQ5R8Y7_9ACTN|nr:cytochrome P450 [Phytohabitans aurantiacus]GLI02848.1 biflaviolin synthase CYP158A2 [Phytohabitans aurantiacus]
MQDMSATPLRHPFYVDNLGVNRPPGPDKHPYYSQFAASGSSLVPVVRTVHGRPVDAFLVCRYMDVKEVFRRQEVFSRTAAALADHIDVSGTLLGLDGEKHATVRGTVKDAFTASAVTALRDVVDHAAAGQLAAMTNKGRPADLVQDFALPFTLHVICDMLGLPGEDRMKFRKWGDTFLATGGLTREEAAQSAMEMGAYLWQQLEQRRGQATGDVLTRIATAAADQPMDVQIKLAIALVVGGWETTATSIATFVFVLHTRPYRTYKTGWDYLLDHPEQLGSAVAELQRLYSTAAGDELPRRVMADVELPSGARLSKGDIVIPSPDAANRDPSVFPRPDEMDFERNPNPHLTFGHGPHYCVGAHLGALELRTAIGVLLRELPQLRLAVPASQVPWKAGHSLLGPEELPVEW